MSPFADGTATISAWERWYIEGVDATRTDLAAELQRIYDSEINVEISWLWDGGIEVKLGDSMNGFVAETLVATISDVVPWLKEAINSHFPRSKYNLDRLKKRGREHKIVEFPR